MRMSGPAHRKEDKDITVNRWLSIIGIGEDGVEGLSADARACVETAVLVVGGKRHLALAKSLIKGKQLAWPSPLEEGYPKILNRRGEPVVVLASGDPMHYGVGKKLLDIVSPEEISCLPQPSAFSLSASRMGWALQDTACISLHGRALERIISHLHPGRRILALSWDGTTPEHVKDLMNNRGLGASRVTVLENVGGPNERITCSTIKALALEDIAPLNTLAIEVSRESDPNHHVSFAAGLDDSAFEHDGQLTKREVRALVLSSLAPRYGEVLWDIGLGAGSIAIEWMLQHHSLHAIGIEECPSRAERARRNALNLGTPNLEIVTGRAPTILNDLAPPDKIFIGGGLTDDGVFEAAWQALKPGGRLVANAVTLQSEARVLDYYARYGGDLTRVGIARADPVGTLTGWRSAMPITHWKVIKP